MREGHGERGARAGLREEARGRALVQRRQGLLQPGERRHLRERALHAEHGRGVDEVARGRRAARPAVLDDQAERTGRRQRLLPRAPRRRRELGEQRPGVQRVAPRAVTQAAGSHRRQRRAELSGEVAQLGLGEPGQRDGGAGMAVDDAAQALREPGDRVPDADQDEHRVGDQPSHREQQRRQRRPVGPVRVVDDDHDDGVVVAVEQLEQPGADGDRVVERPGRAGDRSRVEAARAGQLLDDPVGQQRLRLVAARAQDRRRPVAARVGEEPLDQRGLAHSGRAFDLHDPRTAGGRFGEGAAQHA